jgi:hypothetical protein
MASKSRSVRELRNQLARVNKEIDNRINRMDTLPMEMERDYRKVARFISERQTAAEAKFRKSLMSTGDEVWKFAWQTIWDALRDLPVKAAPNTKFKYQELKPALESRQESLKTNLQISSMWGDQVWGEVWVAVWKVIGNLADQYRQDFAAEIKQIEAELQTWLNKQAVLQKEIERQSQTGDGLYNVIKKVTNSMVKPPED